MRRSILQTLTYFDIFDYPLTMREIWHWLWEPTPDDRATFDTAMEELLHAEMIEKHDGYYTMPGRGAIIARREIVTPHSEQKLLIARRAGKILRFIPFLKAIFVCNTVASGTANATSDIDVFIVSQEKRLWLTRLIATALLTIARLRRHGRHVSNRICLSFYVTDNSLDLSPIMIQGVDIYLAHWIYELIPLYDPNNLREQILKKNTWAQAYLPNASSGYSLIHHYRVDNSAFSSRFKKFFEKIWGNGYGDLLERQAKKIQQTRMKIRPRQTSERRHVIITDTMMKFHEEDQRTAFHDQWIERLKLYAVY